MNKFKLDKDEQEELESAENALLSGTAKSFLTDERKAELQTIAQNTFKKDSRINIRLSKRDLEAIKIKAMEEGIPYQTLASSILHKYANDTLIP